MGRYDKCMHCILILESYSVVDSSEYYPNAIQMHIKAPTLSHIFNSAQIQVAFPDMICPN